jgi:hypothetical protein
VSDYVSGVRRELQSADTCPTSWAVYTYVDTNYPPWANFTKCDSGSYPISIDAR